MSVREFSFLMFACTLWAFHFVVAKLAMGVAPPIFYAAMRMALLALVLSPLLRVYPGRMVYIIIAGLCLGSINFALLFTGVSITSSSSAALATQLGAPMATLMAVFFLGERIGWRRILGISISFIGVSLVGFNPSDFSLDVGLLLVAAAMASESVGAIFVKRLVGVSPIRLQAWFGLVGVVTLSILSLAVEDGQWAAVEAGGWRLGVALCYSSLGASMVAFSIYYWLLQRHDVGTVAPLALMTPILAILFGVTLLRESFTWLMAAGAALTLLGVGIVLVRSGKRMHAGGASQESP